jgi:hypothetical protein
MSKETKSKLYWSLMVTSADQNGNPHEVEFRLYVHKWRVPEPYPQKIYVKIEPSQIQQKPKFLSVDEALDNPDLRTKPINAILHGFKRYPDAFRYHPIEDQSEWEIGEPYVPYDFTFGESEYLKLTIKWEKPKVKGYLEFSNS